MTDNSNIARRRYLKYAAAGIIAGAAAIAGSGFYSYQSNQEAASREFNGRLYPPQKLRVGSKGMCYAVGGTGIANQRSFSWDKKTDIETIHDVLGCDAIRVYGSSEGGIIECARMAAEKDFKTILLLPFYIDATREELIRKVGALAKEAEKLRRDYGDRIILMPGNELSCTSRGILPGDTYVDRCYAIAEHQNDEDVKKRLQQLLNDLISVSRDGFSGQLCYGAGSWEWWLPWDELDLDILGDQHYWYKDYGNPEDPDNVWFEHVKHYKRYGKRYFLAEYECSPYVGSFDFGGGDWQRSGNKDEEAQAQYIDKYHKMFNKADDLGLHIDGSFYLNYWGKPDANDSCLVEPAGLVEHRRRAFYMFASWEKQKSGDALEQRPLSHSDYLCEGTNGLGM